MLFFDWDRGFLFQEIRSLDDPLPEQLSWHITTVGYGLNMEMIAFDECYPGDLSGLPDEERGPLVENLTLDEDAIESTHHVC